jgi:hypothetical protein
MEVFHSILHGQVPDEKVSDDLVRFVEARIQAEEQFHVKSVPKGKDPVQDVGNGTLGYFPHYGVAFIANPEKDRGNIGIDPANKRLVLNPDEAAFHHQRDSYVFAYQELLLVRPGFPQVIQEFEGRGYGLWKFGPKQPGQTLSDFSPAELPVNGRANLNDLL